MWNLLNPDDSTVFDVQAGPIDTLHWLFSVIVGILMCRIVYLLTGVLSVAFFEGYSKLSNDKKVEWNNRGFSTFHALVVAVASFYFVVVSDLFDEDSHYVLMINRTTTASNTILGVSFGYFLSDIAMILWYFPALGGMEYVLHHGLSMLSLSLSLVTGEAQIYILMVLFTETTTPFVNLRWYLDVAGQKQCRLYTWNGVALFLGWLVARILLFIFLFYHMYSHFDLIKEMTPLCFYSLLLVSPVLTLMNLFWFWKITKGMIKTLSKASHSP